MRNFQPRFEGLRADSLRSLDKHRVAEGEKAIFVLDRLPIGVAHAVVSGERRHQYEQRRARQVEVGEQRVDHRKREPRRYEEICFRLAGVHDAVVQRGTFERADSGTLFLDEVGDMSLKTQAKVLRALDEQRFYPVGASTPTHVDVRVIAATNKDLEEEIARGNFREDLFYRLNVIPFFVPPLRDRREDIPLLAREFLADLGQEYGRARIEISDTAINQLKSYYWPGNVRELRNVIERVLILNPKAQRIEAKHLPMLVQRTDGISGPGAASRSGSREEFSTLQAAREAYERDYILKELDRTHGNISRAAEALGLERSHLYRKMKTLGIHLGE